MIYIFQGCQSICSLPGLLCKGCGQLCGAMNCKPIQEACGAAGDCVKHFFERPLSTFVICSLLISAAQLYSVYLGFDKEAAAEVCGTFSGTLSAEMFLGVQAAVAITLIFFAPYLQRSVWKAIMEDVKIPPESGQPEKYSLVAKKESKKKPAEQNLAPDLEDDEPQMVNVDKAVVQGAF